MTSYMDDLFLTYGRVLKYRAGQARGKDGRWIREGSSGGDIRKPRRESRSSLTGLSMDLKRSIGIEGSFNQVFNQLKNLKRAQVVEIANSVLAYPLNEKSTKQKALDRLVRVHRQVLGFNRHLEATRGRTAG